MSNENIEKKTTYTVEGEEVTLSRQIVRQFLARGNDAVTDADIVQFISLCRANQLNPFVGDAYLVRYKGKDGAKTSMIISKEAFMKRAESDARYEGFQAGIIIRREGKIIEEEGAFFVPGDELVGGWCRVYNGRKFPTLVRVRLQEYNKGQSTWAVMPATMIRKVALAQAFREAFPLKVGGMYLKEEIPADEQSGEAPAAIENAEKPKFIDAPAPEETRDPEAPEFTPDPEPEEQEGPDPALVKAGLVDNPEGQEKEVEQDLFTL